MKKACLLLLATSLLAACGRTEKAQDTTTSSTTTPTDSAAPPAPKPQNCQSLAEADKLGKPLVYQESAKPLKFTLTLDQDTSATQTADGCYFNNTITVLATKRAGQQLFKRTLLKDDLIYFSEQDEAIERSVLQSATYKPTFNGEKYFLLTMRLVEPGTKKTTNYTLFINYHGEIVKVRQG